MFPSTWYSFGVTIAVTHPRYDFSLLLTVRSTFMARAAPTLIEINMIRSPDSRLVPSTLILERELDAAESSLRDSLAAVTKVNASSDDIHIREYIGTLKSKSEKYAAVNHALASRKKKAATYSNPSS